MKFHSRISAKALLAAAALAASPAAWSLGLGDATVESYLDQPLRARIDLITQASDDLASVSAKLASAADYELIGASLEDISVPVRFTLQDIGGDAYLLASSELPVNNPVIRLIVEVNWSSGRMLREYTLFLDPPTASDQPPPLPRIDQREADQVVTAPEPAPAPAVPAAEPAPADTSPAAREPVARDSSPAPGEYGPVASGETLWAIASKWSEGSGLAINKVMIAIQRENPEAFLDNNINLLKRGAILRMPEVRTIDRISSQVANSEVATQEEAFYESKGMLSPSAVSAPLLSDDRAEDEYAYPDPRQPAVEPAPDPVAVEPEAVADAAAADGVDAESPSEPGDVVEMDESSDTTAEAESAEEPGLIDQLELVPPSEASELDSTYGFEETDEDGNAVATQALRENLARAEEELITQQQQNEYLEERIRELEEQLAAAEEANVADADLAAMEQRLREERRAQQAADVEEPWYSRFGVWLLGLLVLVAALLGWLFSRRSGDDVGDETIQEIKGEAEEVLRVLGDKESARVSGEDAEDVPDADEPGDTEEDEESETAEVEDEDETTPESADAGEKPARAAFGGTQEEASVLDEESSDPEIQLDLARAYISMGDKEAARVILEEVAVNGSEEQQAEARKMLDFM